MKNSEYFYPLYKEEDKRAYDALVDVAHRNNYPTLIGTESGLNEFLRLMVYSGKVKDYRRMRDSIIENVQKGIINTPELARKAKAMEIPRGVDTSWAIFTQDKRICELLDEFTDATIMFVGTRGEKVEFIKRYMLTQLLQDWRGPKLAVVIESLRKKQVQVSALNKLLKLWDFTDIFK